MKKTLFENRFFLIGLFLLLIVRGSFADQNVIPSGSMEPTIHVGDHVLVNKAAYDIHFPFSSITLASVGDPSRGDIIVFFNPKNGVRMIKRLIARPGDHVHIHNGFVTVNGQEVPAELLAKDNIDSIYRETMGTHEFYVRRIHDMIRPETLDFEVPAGSYFAMGDNRDNSLDSRSWGFVPRSLIQGKAVGVIYNLDWRPWPHSEFNRTLLAFD